MEVPQLTPEMIAEFSPAVVDFIRQLLKVIEAQAAVIKKQSVIIRQQSVIIAQQSAKIAELKARLNLNSRNSSKPPSRDGPSVKRAPPKPNNWKQSGGQPGHPKQSCEIIPTERCDEVFACVPSVCRNCSATLSGPVVDGILSAVRQRSANVDETSMGKKHVLWVMATSVCTYYQSVADRTRSQLHQMIGRGYRGVLTTDRHSVYSRLPGSRHQLCWAHLRRDFQAMIDHETSGSSIGKELLSLSDELFDRWQRVRGGTLLKSTFKTQMGASGDFRTRFKEALERGKACGCKKTSRTCIKLLSQEASLY